MVRGSLLLEVDAEEAYGRGSRRSSSSLDREETGASGERGGSPLLGSSKWRAAAPVGHAHRSREVGGAAGWLGMDPEGNQRLAAGRRIPRN